MFGILVHVVAKLKISSEYYRWYRDYVDEIVESYYEDA